MDLPPIMKPPMLQHRQSKTSDESTHAVKRANIGTVSVSEEEEERSFYQATIVPVMEAETGYPSYWRYMEENKHKYWYLNESAGYGNHSRNAEPRCAIIDLSMENLQEAKVSLRCASLTATQAFTALREPPRGVKVQVAVLSIPDNDLGLASEFASLFGLGLKLAPRFFDALHEQLKRHAEFEVSSNARFRCKYVLASGTVVAIAHHFALAKHESPPVVLIAGPPKIHDMIDQVALWDILYDGQPAQDSVIADCPSGVDDPDSEGARYYARLLSCFMKKDEDCTHSSTDLLLECLLPLLQLDILRIRELCSLVRRDFVSLKAPKYKINGHNIGEFLNPTPSEDKTPDKLYRCRTILRSAIEQFEDEAEPLTDFVSSQIGENSTGRPAYVRIEKARDWVLKEACRLEAEIRDYLQVQSGQLALLESRKSIELSIQQIEEAKRVKIFTVLAFVYVPLNLATSLFGMNLQQLNGSGTNFGAFMGTVVVALIFTGGLWCLTVQLNSLIAWRKRGVEVQRRQKRPDYSIAVRLAMLAWLVANGHWSWMHRSGAGWLILINSGSGYRNEFKYSVWVAESKGLAAGDFVSKFANRDIAELKELLSTSPFDIRSGGWITTDTKASV